MENKADILIIDDEELITGAIEKIAEFENFTTDSSLDVNEALAKLETNKYNLIISDIMMPGKSGFELLEIINQRRITTPVIITTGFSTLENAVRALEDGAMGFIPKPFTIDELISVLHRGMKYQELLKNKYLPSSLIEDDLLSFIPCPPKYYRLGFDTWILEGPEGTVKIGLTDLFLKSIGMVESFENLQIDETLQQGGSCLKILDNNQLTHQLLSPIGGKIIDVNQKILQDASLLEKDPYFRGWIYRVIPNNLENDINNLTSCSSDF